MGTAGGLVAGLLAGFVQWAVLRKSVRHAWIWILVNGLAWAVAVAVGMVVFDGVYQGYYSSGQDIWGQPKWWAMGMTASGIVGTAVFGLLTGAGLVWLLRGGKPLVPAALMALVSLAIMIPAGLELMPSVLERAKANQGDIGMEQGSTPVQITSGAVCGTWQGPRVARPRECPGDLRLLGLRPRHPGDSCPLG